MFARYTIPLLLVGIATLGVIFYADREYTRLEQLRAQEVRLDNDLKDILTIEAQRAMKMAAYDAFPKDSEARLRTLAPEELHPARFIIDVLAVARRVGIEIKEPSVSEADVGKNLPERAAAHQLTFEFAATYPKFKEFLHAMEESLVLREPMSVTLSKVIEGTSVDRATGEPIYAFSVVFASYSLQ